MRRRLSFLIVLLPLVVGDRSIAMNAAPIVFLDIAGPDTATQKSFYADLFAWRISDANQMNIPVRLPLPAALRMDPAEKRIYIGVADVAKKLDQIKAHGGTVDAPRFVVPGVAIIGLFKDPAGNPMGLIEMAKGKPKIP
jgi:predicted enzyme related to lactoylglutathione lyase